LTFVCVKNVLLLFSFVRVAFYYVCVALNKVLYRTQHGVRSKGGFSSKLWFCL